MIKVIVCGLLEKSINGILVLDGQKHAILQKHAGKVLKLSITDLSLVFYFVFRAEKIYVYSDFSDSVDTHIEASSFTFLKQMKSSVTEKELHIEGDTEFAQDLFHLLKNTKINWEEYLSYFVGDLPVTSLQNVMRQFKQTAQNISTRTKEDLIEFIQEEKRFIPTREEVEDFYEDIIELRCHIDRLEARWDRLMEKSKNETT